MAIDPHFIPAFSIETVILDKDTGAPLSGGQVSFQEDNQRGIFKPVYQITGVSPAYSYTQLPNPMTLSSIGTFEDSMGNPVVPYFYPYKEDITSGELEVDYYYVSVESYLGVPQFDREAVPYIPDTGESSVQSIITNEISNPQFAQVLFDTTASTFTYNFMAATNQVVNIAPDWDLIVTCPTSGTVTVRQLTPTGSLNILTNPCTLLNIRSAGITSLQLRQRLFGSPNLWGNGYLSASFVAKNYENADITLNLYYSQSSGTVKNQLIVSAVLPSSGAYNAYPGSIQLPISDNTQDFPNAYIDIYFDLPLNVQMDITSLIVSGTRDAPIDNISYNQVPLARQIDQLFHYYQPGLNFKPIPSLLTAWDFPLNPAQFGSSGNITTTPAYIWDQTIAFSRTTSLPFIRNTVTAGLDITTAGSAPDAFLLCQYLSGNQVKKILGTELSANLNAWSVTGGGITYTIYLFRGSSTAVIPTLPNLIGGLAADGTFTVNTTSGQGLNWTEITRGQLSAPSGTLSVISTNPGINDGLNDYGFSGWEITDTLEIGDTDKFCIIVTFSYTNVPVHVVVQSMSLVPGTVPTRPASQQPDEVLRESQYYYELSEDNGVVILMESLCQPAANTTQAYSSPFEIVYNVEKRVPPTFTTQSVALTSANVSALLYYSANFTHNFTTLGPTDKALATFWATPVIGTKSLFALPKVITSLLSTTSSTGDTAFAYSSAAIQFYYILDSRLGIV